MRFSGEYHLRRSLLRVNNKQRGRFVFGQLQRKPFEFAAKHLLPAIAFAFRPPSIGMPFQPQRSMQAGDCRNALREALRGFLLRVGIRAAQARDEEPKFNECGKQKKGPWEKWPRQNCLSGKPRRRLHTLSAARRRSTPLQCAR